MDGKNFVAWEPLARGLKVTPVLLALMVLVSGCYQEPKCVKWADAAVKKAHAEKFVEGRRSDSSYVLSLWKEGKIQGIPKGYKDWGRGCCKDRLDYLIFYYPNKKGFNEVEVSAQWITCEDYEGYNSWKWPPDIKIFKRCWGCKK